MRTWYGAVVGDIETSEGGHDGKIRSTAWQGLLTCSCSWSHMARRDGDGEGAAGAMRRRHHGAATTTTTTASLFMAVPQ